MSDITEGDEDLIYATPEALRERTDGDRGNPPPSSAPKGGDVARIPDNAGAGSTALPFDLWALTEAVMQRWRWMAAATVLLFAVGACLGLMIWKTQYTAVAQLVRYESPNTVDVFGYRQITPQTFAGMFRSPELLQRVASKSRPRVALNALATGLRVLPERNSDIVAVAISAETPEASVALANLYAGEAVRFTQEMQSASAIEVSQYLKQQISQMDVEILEIQRLWQGIPRPTTKSNAATVLPPAPRGPAINPRLEAAKEELLDLLARYTEAHPLVQAHRAKMAAIEEQIKERRARMAPAPPASENPEAVRESPAYAAARKETTAEVQLEGDPEVMRSKLQSLENGRLLLAGRQRAAQSFADNPPGYFRILAPALAKEVVKNGRKTKVAFLAAFCGLIGAMAAASAALCIEFLDERLKTSSDVKRVARLPVLARLDDLHGMTGAAQRNWAFRTWTRLQRRMSISPNHGLVCGITSANRGEGRSRWVSLLAQAASQQGFRVLTIATRPSPDEEEPEPTQPAPPPPPAHSKRNGKNGKIDEAPNKQTALLPTNVLASPAEVTEELTGPNPQPHVHIPLPGWVWNLERRKQWQAALNHWRQIDNIVILVELPPASVPESVLLAENLPNIIWLADSGKTRARDACVQLETLRNARCNLVGVVMNHETDATLQKRFLRWMPSQD
jgi:capsular polysaccharide biosynthesis protein